MSTTIYTKKCTKCNKFKSFDEFNKHKNHKDGLKYTCKQCDKEYNIVNMKHIKKRDKIYSNSLALYDTYAHQLTVDEEPRLSDDGISLEVRCKYCGKYFKPTNSQVSNRISSINGNMLGDNNLYCSDNCKKSCGTYDRKRYPKGFKQNTSREVQPALRKLVLERDNWTCQKCDSIDILHCHHYEGIEINPVESADMDNCITLCKKCHNKIHKDCDMRRQKC